MAHNYVISLDTKITTKKQYNLVKVQFTHDQSRTVLIEDHEQDCVSIDLCAKSTLNYFYTVICRSVVLSPVGITLDQRTFMCLR